MSVVLLDPRFPAMIPVEAAKLLQGDVAYTDEVPVRIRWVIADLGGHVVDDSEVLVTTDIASEQVRERLDNNENLIKAPSLLVEFDGDRELEAADAAAASVAAGQTDNPDAQAGPASDAVVDGEVVESDAISDVPDAVMEELQVAISLISRALRQGEWEQSQTHESLVGYLREETEELARIIAVASNAEWVEQELCQELSDILLQVLFHAEIANRRGTFDIGHVAAALTVKLRSRAPYLFDSEERFVERAEQNRLWAEGKASERQRRVDKYGVEYQNYSQSKTSGQVSGMVAADKVIREAREKGLSDAEIPTEIRFPMVGLELDEPGQAEQRLLKAVEKFRKHLAER